MSTNYEKYKLLLNNKKQNEEFDYISNDQI